jgi:hypothetical protein
LTLKKKSIPENVGLKKKEFFVTKHYKARHYKNAIGNEHFVLFVCFCFFNSLAATETPRTETVFRTTPACNHDDAKPHPHRQGRKTLS